MKLHVGISSERLPTQKYAEHLPFVELALKGRLPRFNTLRDWRASMPDGLKVAYLAPLQTFCGQKAVFAVDSELKTEMKWLENAASAAKADFLVFRTPAAFGPSTIDRGYFRDYLGKLSTNAKLVWQPRGMWEEEDAKSFADECGVLLAIDSFESEVPVSTTYYARNEAMGARKRFGEGYLLRLVDSLLEKQPAEAFITFSSDRSFDEARNLLALFASMLG